MTKSPTYANNMLFLLLIPPLHLLLPIGTQPLLDHHQFTHRNCMDFTVGLWYGFRDALSQKGYWKFDWFLFSDFRTGIQRKTLRCFILQMMACTQEKLKQRWTRFHTGFKEAWNLVLRGLKGLNDHLNPVHLIVLWLKALVPRRRFLIHKGHSFKDGIRYLCCHVSLPSLWILCFFISQWLMMTESV